MLPDPDSSLVGFTLIQLKTPTTQSWSHQKDVWYRRMKPLPDVELLLRNVCA
jgi:hypothetical protein